MLTTWRDSHWTRLCLNQSPGNRTKVELIIPRISMKLLYSIIHVDQHRHIGSKNNVLTFTQLIYSSCPDIRPVFLGTVWWHLVYNRPAPASFCQCIWIFNKQKIASLCGGEHSVNKMITSETKHLVLVCIWVSTVLGWTAGIGVLCKGRQLNTLSLMSGRFRLYDCMYT